MKRADRYPCHSATREFRRGRRTHCRLPVLAAGLLVLAATLFAPRAYAQVGFPGLAGPQFKAAEAALCQTYQIKIKEGLASRACRQLLKVYT
jgi:hypothetical protein